MPSPSQILSPTDDRARPGPAERQRRYRLAFAFIVSAGAAALSGCAMSRVDPVAVAGTNSSAAHVKGRAFGGQQPISGAQMQLYAAGTGGNASAATALLTSAVYTDAGGRFDITGLYTCPSATSQVYLTAMGGNPGLPGNVNNGSSALMVALGDCGSLSSVPLVEVNELTTVAAAWALAPFASTMTNLGASSTNLAGIRGAMKTAMMMVDPYSGSMPSSFLPANATFESAKLITLADILAACVNSDGSACSGLFSDATPPGMTSPQDTFAAAVAIVQHPGSSVGPIFNQMPAQAAFPGALTVAPQDWTMSFAYTGGGMHVPAAVAVDAQGNVWVASTAGVLSAFSQQGAPRFSTGITGAGLNLSSAITIDPSANIWVANQATSGISGPGSVTAISSFGAPNSGAQGFTAGGINMPFAVAADTTGNVWVANRNSQTVTLLDPNGNPLSGSTGFGSGLLSSPSALAVDLFHNVWVANAGSGSLVKVDTNGNALKNLSCCTSPDSLALDSLQNVWIGDRSQSTLMAIESSGAALTPAIQGGGLNGPAAMAMDTVDHLFVVNEDGNTLSEFAGSRSAEGAGSILSPAAGLGGDAHLRQPQGAAIDQSGNLWVASSADDRLVCFVGMASPVKTPRFSVPQVP